jgi:hypothetical protein
MVPESQYLRSTRLQVYFFIKCKTKRAIAVSRIRGALIAQSRKVLESGYIDYRSFNPFYASLSPFVG